jgi:hypothetical protein
LAAVPVSAELVAVTFAFSIVRHSMLEFPDRVDPAPIPEPLKDEPLNVLVLMAALGPLLLAVTFPFAIVRYPIIELPE